MKKRDSGIELLRVISMLMVILIHAFLYGNYYSVSMSTGGLPAEISTFIKIGLRPAVNIFLLISGYFMVKSEFNLKKNFTRVFKTYLRVWIYSVILMIIFLFLGAEFCMPFQSETALPVHKIILKSIFPITSQMWYFIGNYIILCLLAPFINIVLQTINKKQFQILLLITTLLMSVWMTLLHVYPFKLWFNSFTFDSVYEGKSLFSFIYIYLIGGYIGLHAEKRNKPKLIYLLASILCIIINFLLYTYINPETGYKSVAMIYSNPFVILQGVFMLLFFKDVHFYSKIINALASTTLGVYAIHEHVFVRSVLWEKLFNFKEINNPIIFDVIIISVCIFIVLAIVDLIFQKIFNFFTQKNK